MPAARLGAAGREPPGRIPDDQDTISQMRPIASRRRTARALLGGVLLFGGLPGIAFAEGDAEAGAGKAYTCLGCHGVKHYVNTYPTYKVPRIAGQNAEYLIAALQAYKGGLRKHETMQANAGLLSDQDIEDVAAWFASQGQPSP